MEGAMERIDVESGRNFRGPLEGEVRAIGALSKAAIDPHVEDFFDRLQQYSMIWLSIALIQRTAGDLRSSKHRDFANAADWAKDYRDRSYPTSLARCCDWISGALPDGKTIAPRAISYLLLYNPEKVRRVCDKYLQDNLPDFDWIGRKRANPHLLRDVALHAGKALDCGDCPEHIRIPNGRDPAHSRPGTHEQLSLALWA
jgi:hypothetical protein